MSREAQTARAYVADDRLPHIVIPAERGRELAAELTNNQCGGGLGVDVRLARRQPTKGQHE